MAFVVSVTDDNMPVSEHKLGNLKEGLLNKMNEDGDGLVRVWTVGHVLSEHFPINLIDEIWISGHKVRVTQASMLQNLGRRQIQASHMTGQDLSAK